MQKWHETVRGNIDHEFTIYKRECHPNNPSDMWLASPETNEYTAEYYTGLVQHVIIDKCGNTWIGMSQCSKRDTFNKKIGRAIARGRAEKAYYLFRSDNKKHKNTLVSTSVTTGGFLKKEIHGIMYTGNGGRK